MRLVDADVIKAKLMEYIGLTNGFDRAFNETPTIDAVEVVRCKDCKWRKACKVFSQQQITDDSYCSWGEREGK